MNFQHSNKVLAAVSVSLLLQGCMTSYDSLLKKSTMTDPSVEQGLIQVGKNNLSSFAGVQLDLEKVIAIESYQSLNDQTQYLESLLYQYASQDGRFEQAVYCALAISYLEQGKREDFLRNAQHLSTHLSNDTYLTPEMQYVMEIYQVMGGQNGYKGKGRDPKIHQVIQDLISLKGNDHES